MEWPDILNIIVALMMAVIAGIGLPIALRNRKKQSPKISSELYHHLLELGVDAYLPESETGKEKIGIQRFSSTKSQSLIGIRGKNIEWINLIGVSTQYGTNYFLDFQVTSPNLDIRKPKKTFLKKPKKIRQRGKPAVVWTGDNSFSTSLRLNYRLEDLLIQSEFQESIEIAPEPKYGCTRIRIPYILPSDELFEAIDIIAGHIKSEF